MAPGLPPPSHHSSETLSDLRLPRAQAAGSLTVPDGARARALERLHEIRVAQVAAKRAPHPIDRRAMLCALANGAFAVGAWTLLGRSMGTHTSPPPHPASAHERVPASQSAIEQGCAFSWETVLFQSGFHAAGRLCQHLNLPLGNSALKVSEVPKSSIISTIELFERDPLVLARLYTTVGWLGPIIEESLFRIVPNLFVSHHGMQWQVGLPTSLAFAAMHNVVPTDRATSRAIPISESMKLSLDLVPLPQFILGAYCWYVMRKYGSLAPMVAHVFNNQAAAFSVVWGGRETYSTFKRLLAEEIAVQSAHPSQTGPSAP